MTIDRISGRLAAFCISCVSSILEVACAVTVSLTSFAIAWLVTKTMTFGGGVTTKAQLVRELADEMRDGRGKKLPTHIVAEDGDGFPGPASQYDQAAAAPSAAARDCRAALAAKWGVQEEAVSIIGASAGSAELTAAGKVVVKYRRAVDVSPACQECLDALLQHRPDRRCTWEQFFACPFLAG